MKYEEVYLHDYRTVSDAYTGLGKYFRFYNNDRLHQSLGYRIPVEVYRGEKADCSAVLISSAAEYCKECASLESRIAERNKLATAEEK